MSSTPLIETQEVAARAREYARKHGLSVGSRGRLSRETLAEFFKAQPHEAREVAAIVGIAISQRGRLSQDDADKVAIFIR